jgi:hypothetical protein
MRNGFPLAINRVSLVTPFVCKQASTVLMILYVQIYVESFSQQAWQDV